MAARSRIVFLLTLTSTIHFMRHGLWCPANHVSFLVLTMLELPLRWLVNVVWVVWFFLHSEVLALGLLRWHSPATSSLRHLCAV